MSDSYASSVLGLSADEFRKVKKSDIKKANDVVNSDDVQARWRGTRGDLRYGIVNDEDKGPCLLMLGVAHAGDD